ncbi:hypothetical protein VULLAG_LOCUS10946 [Vulpes lagopus]
MRPAWPGSGDTWSPALLCPTVLQLLPSAEVSSPPSACVHAVPFTQASHPSNPKQRTNHWLVGWFLSENQPLSHCSEVSLIPRRLGSWSPLCFPSSTHIN